MAARTSYQIHETEVELSEYQLQKLNELLVFVSQFNEFYKEKLKDTRLPIKTMEEFLQLPFTTKEELADDQQKYPPFGRNHSYPETSYIRYHQTSGTSGRPLKVLDTASSWKWWEDCWFEVLKSSGVTKSDRLFLAFSFGPFIGFWAAYEGAKKVGALVIPGGGQSSKERLYSIIENKATVLLCTPSYALHLAEIAEDMGIDLPRTSIRIIITAGEPGGSVPSTRQKIEKMWGAAVYDHVGMTEMGAYGYSCSEQKGIHVNESQFLVEIIDPETLKPVKQGERGELVLTNFGRYGYPLIRYRTRDMVINSSEPCACGNPYKFLPGGIIGRVDDMVVIRGVNIFPSSIEAIIREFEEIKEFRIVYYTREEMDQVKVQIETSADIAHILAERLRERIGLRIDVEQVELGSLPRFTMKSKRVIDERISKD
ncbi:phenylacetate-CoA ligase [Anoxybacillus vitaminiphilus]|uniref:Phenylacetate-CoA ligase n=1 Tax=Paranoxybacillus vitaminiphilus TaxID=581036 RepID=A0A327Y1H2_9BACL|nr:AMP-binding protein [Anoxybacillus vitaminiphilus]RAK15068.1 phenylacetate-CoA ligase [Anoxybacillus vitaminiphilus]